MSKIRLITISLLLSGCAGQMKELKTENETQNQIMGRMLSRIRTLEAERDNSVVDKVKLEAEIEDLRAELKRVEYIIFKEDLTKCQSIICIKGN